MKNTTVAILILGTLLQIIFSGFAGIRLCLSHLSSQPATQAQEACCHNHETGHLKNDNSGLRLSTELEAQCRECNFISLFASQKIISSQKSRQKTSSVIKTCKTICIYSVEENRNKNLFANLSPPVEIHQNCLELFKSKIKLLI